MSKFLNPDACANCWHVHGLPLEDRWSDWCKDSLCTCTKFQSARTANADLLAALERERDEARNQYRLEQETRKNAQKDYLHFRAEAMKLRVALKTIINELGVPSPDYPAPVANAVDIARAAIAGKQVPEERR